MSAANLTALISSITALVGAVTGLVILIVHIIRHQQIPPANQSESPGPSGPVIPAKAEKWHN